MNKKAQLSTIKTAIIVAILVSVILFIFVTPLGKLFSYFFDTWVEEKCEISGKTQSEYRYEIEKAIGVNDIEETIELYEEHEECDFEKKLPADLLYQIGSFYESANDKSNAIEVYQKITKDYPNSESAIKANTAIRRLS